MNRSQYPVQQYTHLSFQACQPKHYQENLVGEALNQLFSSKTCKREDVWIQTKFTSLDGQDPNRIPYDKTKVPPEQVKESIEISRRNLKVEVIDSLVLHSPMRGGFQATLDVWRAMEEAVDQGKVQVLGISNCYDLKMFTNLYNVAKHKPRVLQNRFYKETGWDNDLRAFCLRNEVVYQSFWTLTANPKLLKQKFFLQIAQKYQITVEQLLYKFLCDLGHQPLSGCTTWSHVKEAVAVREIPRLGDDELMKIKEWIGDQHPL